MMEGTSDLVVTEIQAGIATPTLNSPREPKRPLRGARRSTRRRAGPGVGRRQHPCCRPHPHRSHILCGRGLKEAAVGGMRQGAEALLGVLRKIVHAPAPVIAHLKGNARAGGIGLVGAADIAVAPTDTTCSFSEVRLGLAPAIISLTVLPRIDDRAAGRYFLTGETFDGHAAARIGLLTDAPHDVPVTGERVAEIVAALRLCSRQGLTESKKLPATRTRQAIEEQGADMVKLSADLFASEEATEGMLAFRNRRPPRWALEQLIRNREQALPKAPHPLPVADLGLRSCRLSPLPDLAA